MESSNTSESIQKIKEFIIKIWEYLKENKLFVVFIAVALVLVIITYFYSETYRVNYKTSNILQSLRYDKKRENIDYCGDDNNVIDKMYTSVTFDSNDNTMELGNPYINLYDLGLSSEYLLNISGSEMNDGVLNVESIIGKNKIKIDKKTPIKTSNVKEDITQTRPILTSLDSEITRLTDENVTITYYRPNSNINPYKYKKLTDYYVASSHRSFLVGHQKADYCSLDMINRVLYLGARYIELEIFNKENRNDSVPVVSSGYNDAGLRLTLNYIDLEDCLRLIGQMAFSETYLLNFTDPLFIFLNLKTNGNQNTINQVAKIVKSTLGNKLLPRKFLNTNMGFATLCDLKGKAVIFSSPGWKGTDLEEVVNSGTDSPYLNRLTFNEVKLYTERSKPKITIRKNTVRFYKGATNSEIEFTGNDVDLTKYGVNNGDNVTIKGAKRNENNSGNFLFKINNISRNKISFDKAVNLSNEAPGSMVSVDIYDFTYKGNDETLEEFNKNNLTICVPDDNFLSGNYNFKDAMFMGCQFVTMNYQNVDDSMKEYFNYFMKRSFQPKPNSLVNDRELPKTEGLAAQTPNPKPSLDFDVDYSFIQKYMNKVITISTEAFPELKLGVDERDYEELRNSSLPARMILDGDKKNIEFLVTKGKDNRSDTVSLMIVDNNGSNEKNFLKFNDNCCFLTYDKILNESTTPNYDYVKERTKLRNMSFIPMKTLSGEANFSRFGVIMKKTVGNETGDVLYYLKHRKQFTPRFKLFTKYTNTYRFKTMLFTNNRTSTGRDDPNSILNYSAVLTPRLVGNRNFLPMGDIVVPLSKLDFTDSRTETEKRNNVPSLMDSVVVSNTQTRIEKTMVVNGSVAHPVEFALLFENRYYKNRDTRLVYIPDAPLSIWKPIAPEGFTCLGVVFQNSYAKPNKEDFYCVSNDFIKEETYIKGDESNPDAEKEFYENIFDHSETGINIWRRDANNEKSNISNYVVVKNVRTETDGKLKPPNPFDNQHFIVNLNPDDYKDRIYIDNVIENNRKDRKSCNFKIKLSSEDMKAEDNRRYDKLLEIEGVESKLMSFIKTNGGGNMCMGLPQPYNSTYFKEVNRGIDIVNHDGINDSKLAGMSCGDASNFGTNFKFFNDNSIRLADNNDFCVTYSAKSNGRINKDKDDENNFLYLKECNRNLDNQSFVIEDNSLKVLTNDGSSPNACVTIGSDNTLKLEECGDQKYTALNLWNNQINRDDKCFKEEAEEKLKELSNIEQCDDSSYYIIYLQGIVKSEELCDLSSAKTRFNELVTLSGTPSQNISAISYAHKGIFIESTKYPVPNVFNSELTNIESREKTCSNCKKPSKMLCSKGRLLESVYNSFENFEEEQRLMKYCIKMRDVDDFRCGRSNRQKFLHFPTPEDYCLNAGKQVYVQFPEILESSDAELSSGVDVVRLKQLFSRKNVAEMNIEQLPVQNLLNEYYNSEYYSVFIRANLRPDGNKYKLLFDWNIFSPDSNPYKKLFKPIKVPTNSEFICLDYEPRESMLKVGSKVLVNFDQFFFEVDSGSKVNSPKINKVGVKYLGVIIKKLSPKTYKVMLSINSYESNYKKYTKVGIKYYKSNPVMNFDISDLTLFKRAEVCLKK